MARTIINLLAIAGFFSHAILLECQLTEGDKDAINPYEGPIFREADDVQNSSANSTQLRERLAGSANNKAGPQSQWATKEATERKMKELKDIQKCDSYKRGIFEVRLKNETYLDYLLVIVHILPDGLSELSKGLQRLREEKGWPDFMLLGIIYDPGYPTNPPWIHVRYPHLATANDRHFCPVLKLDDVWHSGMSTESVVLSAIDTLAARKPRVSFRWTTLKKLPADLRPAGDGN